MRFVTSFVFAGSSVTIQRTFWLLTAVGAWRTTLNNFSKVSRGIVSSLNMRTLRRDMMRFSASSSEGSFSSAARTV